MSNIRRFSLPRSQGAHGRIFCAAGVIACKKLPFSLTLRTRKKIRIQYLRKKFLENEFLKDVKMYQKKKKNKLKGKGHLKNLFLTSNKSYLLCR